MRRKVTKMRILRAEDINWNINIRLLFVFNRSINVDIILKISSQDIMRQ